MTDGPAVDRFIDTRLRVATWNLWWRYGPWEQRRDLIIDAIRRADPDVIALQEAWATADTSAAHEVADALGGHHAVFAGNREVEPGVRFGNAIVSRWPITHHEWRPLPEGDEPDEQRLALRADVDGPRGPLQVFATHLNWRFDHSAVRQDQVRALASFVAESGPRQFPAVVCGDFNAEPHSAEIELLTGQRAVAVPGTVLIDAWRVVHPTEPGFTWDTRNRFAGGQVEQSRRIDYVLVGWPKEGGAGGPVAAELLGTEATGDVWPSDHFGVVADLRY